MNAVDQQTNNINLIADCMNMVKAKSSSSLRHFLMTVDEEILPSQGQQTNELRVVDYITRFILISTMATDKDDGYVFQHTANATTR